jgi:ABC-2 type transport system permease protein
MVRLVAGELRKLFTTALWLWLLLGSVALTALYASLAIAFGDDPDNPTPPLSSPEGQRTVFSVGQGAGALVAVLGVIGYTGEFRHRTATPTFLATPARWRVLLAKLILYPFIGAGYGIVCLAGTSVLAVLWLSAKGIPVSLGRNGIPGTMVGVVVAVALFGGLGVGVGALLREQAATVVGLLVYLFVAEPIVTRIPALRDWTIYLPGSASAALTRISQAGQEFLAPWQGGLVLAGYVVAIATAAAICTVRRDVS